MESVDLARLLLDLLVVIAAAKLAAEGAERIGVPAVLGEIVAGILIGPSVLGMVELDGARGVSLGVLAELGVLLLLVQVGMEMDLAELGRVGRPSMLVAVIGVAVPFAGGVAAGLALGWTSDTAIFLGAALTATSVGITARVFGDLRALATTEARIVLGAAVADDVLGLIILTVVVKVVTGDGVTVGLVVTTVLAALLFLVLSGTVGAVAVPRLLALTDRFARSGSSLTVAAVVVILGLSLLADVAQLAFIIGAFMAGLAIGRSDGAGRIAGDLSGVGSLLIPVFFVLIGVNADLESMLEPSVLADAGVLLAIAVAGKIVAALGAAGTRSDGLLIGLGMIPRGEVGLIFASIGLARGVLDDELYGALLLVVLLTTVVTPPLLRWRIRSEGSLGAARLDEGVTEEPATGWVRSRGDVVELRGWPPSSALATVALQAATLAADGDPGDELLDWFGDRRDVPIRWTAVDTARFLEVVRRGSPRSVRFLELTGVLERGVPSVAAAVARRRADPTELDPGRALRFPTVARLGELLPAAPTDGDELDPRSSRSTLLAAVILDVVGLEAESQAVRRLLDELAVEDREGVEHLIRSAELLRGAARDLSGYREPELLHLAMYIATPATLRAASGLAGASLPGGTHRDRLSQLTDLLADVLDHPALLRADATTLADVRRQAAEALSVDGAAIERLRAAPDGYVLMHEPDELARQARLVEPRPAAGRVRVAVTPEGSPDRWIVEAAARDTAGLLAALARALTASGCDITAAAVATWPDGAAVDTFVVCSAVRPRARALAERTEAELGRRLPLEPMPDTKIEFDNASLPWHTACTVTGLDRPGTLAALASALTAAGVLVHSARVASVNTRVVDRFAVTDRSGRKLDGAAMERVRSAMAGRVRRGMRLRRAR